METLNIKQAQYQITTDEAHLVDLRISNTCLNDAELYNVSATGVKITNANLSALEIEGAQLGGAYIHNIGMPPEGHPAYDPEARQNPLKFENCDLAGSAIVNCDLSRVEMIGCDTTGMKINGILIDDLLKLAGQH